MTSTFAHSSGTIAAPGEGKGWSVLGDRIICRTSGRETGGSFSVVEIHSPPGGGPPWHIHHREDELFFVIEGFFEVFLPNQVQRLQCGDMAFGLRGTAHRYRNSGSAPGRLLVTLIPAGFEQFFQDVDRLTRQNRICDPTMAELGGRYQLEFPPAPAGH